MSGRPGVAGRRASASVCVSNCAARSSSRTRFWSLAIAPTQPRPSTGSTLASTPAAFANLPPPGKQSKRSGPAPWLLGRRRAANRRHPGDFCIVIGERQSGTAHQVARAQIVRGRSHLKATADFRLTGSAICRPSVQRLAPSDRGLALVSECTSARFCAATRRPRGKGSRRWLHRRRSRSGAWVSNS